ncbi:MAG TPA: cysteine desulfurase CsdA [Flavobacteriales bacterium]|nr:cysteine desulfurase CsdA [Flavobacteriales bacterium]|tara:strand:+ start:7298 stop:8521 length:1224 start_codon:yes stop_codon:yes gene_type:complete
MDINQIRAQFPILNQEINKRPLVYFDNGATSQKPLRVIESISNYYLHYNSNVHRGVHTLSQKATDKYEQARQKVRQFINANHSEEIIFTRGTTESINLVAFSLSQNFLQQGEEVLISEMEHHSNIVPWQMACERTGAKLKAASFDEKGILNVEELKNLVSEKTKIVALTQVSNALGTINPIKEIIDYVRSKNGNNTLILIDGAQAVPHLSVDVQALDCDFYAFSGHKMYAPTGIGVLYGKKELMSQMTPYQGGGDMIKTVTIEKTEYNELPYRFEAGTPNISGAIALSEAIDFMLETGVNEIARHEHELLTYATEKIKTVSGVKIIGEAPNKAGVLSFVVDGTHPSDIGVLLDKMGVAVRTGHHCAEPVMDKFNIPGTVRASFAVYNTRQEVDIFIAALEKAVNLLR